jgi:glycosyltransferase involved in cell wall biosynthesis
VATALWRDWHRWITIFQAFAIVLRKMPSAKLIMGGGYMCPETHREFPCPDVRYMQKSVAEEYHILDAIEWREPLASTHEAQNELIAETYRQGNVFVHAYFADWGTYTCIEALASGLPVVCGDNGGLPEFAADCAFIYKYGAGYDSPTLPPPNPSEVAERILQAYAGGDELKVRCMQRAKQFEASVVCRGLQQFLEGVAHAG